MPSNREERWLFPLTIFLGSFLLFQVQPLIGKFVLPWFGGSAGVWAAALMFFQVFLLLGYGYAHAVATGLSPKMQTRLHIVVLVLTLVLLPIIPSETLRPSTAGNPTWQLFSLLVVTVGAPYLLLAANGPLLQHWYALLYPGRSPYRLYALSNAASLLALLTYPLWFERAWALTVQAWLWSVTYVAFAALCGLIAWRQGRAGKPSSSPSRVGAQAVGARPRLGRMALWVVLPALASMALLATTNRLTQEVAPVPLLWVLPLALYLATFVLTFDSERWYRPAAFLTGLTITLLATAVFVVLQVGTPGIVLESTLLLANLFMVGMVCHGELVALKPHSRFLTTFYLAIASGGALGGVLVALVAPAIFTTYAEFELAMALAGLVAIVALGREYARRRRPKRFLLLAPSLSGLGACGLYAGILLASTGDRGDAETLATMRNFYGTLRVSEAHAGQSQARQRALTHGRTVHGLQFLDPGRRTWHTAYYGPESGAAVALRRHPSGLEGSALRVGIIGLGTGTLASYAGPGDRVRMYEINPQIVDVAERYFTYLEDAERRGAIVETVLGDARLVMEGELLAGSQQYDVLVIDAFSSDAIPVHLLTAEAFDLYQQHLAVGGIIAIHVSNGYLDLTPVVRALADRDGSTSLLVESEADDATGVFKSTWVIVTTNSDFMADPYVADASMPWPEDSGAPLLWTDGYSSLVPLLGSF